MKPEHRKTLLLFYLADVIAVVVVILLAVLAWRLFDIPFTYAATFAVACFVAGAIFEMLRRS